MATEKRHIDNHLMLERLSKIHAKIKSGCYPNTHQLAFDLGVSIPTISRDIEFLRDRFYAPIEYDASQRGYYYEKDFDMPLNLISSKDVLFLSLVKQLMTQYEGSPIYNVSVNSPLVTKKMPVHYNTGEVKKCGNNIQQKKNKILLQCSKMGVKQ